MIKKFIPGTKMLFGHSREPFKVYEEMIALTDGISLGQVCSIASVEPFVIQNWVKRGYIPRPLNKKYYVRHLARILLINALKDSMVIDDVNELMKMINGDVEDEGDDLIKENDLYNLFSLIIYDLDDITKIDEIVEKDLLKENITNERLKDALKVMLYAYFAGLAHYNSEINLNKMKEKYE